MKSSISDKPILDFTPGRNAMLGSTDATGNTATPLNNSMPVLRMVYRFWPFTHLLDLQAGPKDDVVGQDVTDVVSRDEVSAWAEGHHPVLDLVVCVPAGDLQEILLRLRPGGRSLSAETKTHKF